MNVPFDSSEALGVLVAGAPLIFFAYILLRPRRYYFVRHGETELNKKHIKQGAEGGLAEAGKQQALVVGKALLPASIRKIISSPYERAQQTSELINESLKVPILYTPLLAERRNPSEVIGKHRDDPDVARIVDLIDLTYHDDDYRFSDEENFMDMKKRGKDCLEYLARHGARNTCVVTHHAFLKMILAYALYREALHATDFVKLSYFNVSDNGGISVCAYHPLKRFSRTKGWVVESFNQEA